MPHAQVLSLWLHECSRVFEDRLINDDDHGWFRAQQSGLLGSAFGLAYEEVVTAPRLIYGDFMVPGERQLAGPTDCRMVCVMKPEACPLTTTGQRTAVPARPTMGDWLVGWATVDGRDGQSGQS